ncbi:hypothetical protein pb186bvf_008868 [Paramecium bursaria]
MKYSQSLASTGTTPHWSYSTPKKRKNIMQLNELVTFTRQTSPLFTREETSVYTRKNFYFPKKKFSRSEMLKNYLSIRDKLQPHKPKQILIPRSTSQKELISTTPQRQDSLITQSEQPTVTKRKSVLRPKLDIKEQINQLLSGIDDIKNPNFRYLIKEHNEHKKVTINYKLFCQQILHRLIVLRKLKINALDQIFDSKPFQKPLSQKFLSACKMGDMTSINELLKLDPYLPFSYDYVHLTPLHWAVKRQHIKVVRKLLEFGVDVDAQDLIGRPPIHFAVQLQNYDIIKVLLEHMASPWTMQRITYSKLCNENNHVMLLLNKARKYHVIMKIVKVQQRNEIRDKQLIGVFEI